nr:unnamed protein product [Callosobruchus chinensis]
MWIVANSSYPYIPPLFGFGLYYNEVRNECDRFRYAVEVKDKIYAYLFFAFGATLCICIALCNVAVIYELLKIRSQKKVLVRRVSRSIIVNKERPGYSARYHTPEEMAFAKLMAFICLIFVACWAPQVISVPVSQYFIPPTKSIKVFEKTADTLLTVYFALDPFVYVLQNYFEGRITFNCCFFKKSTSSLASNTNDTEMVCL